MYRAFQKKRFDCLLLNISATMYRIFKLFFPLTIEIHIQILNAKPLEGRDIYQTKCLSETDQFIFVLSHNGLKTTKFVPSSANWPKTGPDSSQVAPSGPSNPN